MVDAIQQGGPGCADSETEAARGVEANVSVLQSQFPPPQLNKSKKKRKRKSQGNRISLTKSNRKEGGSRLVLNKTVAGHGGPNNRTCLLDSISTLLPDNMKELVFSAMAASMPAQGDTSVSHIKNALATHGLLLKAVNGKYLQTGGAPFHLLKESNCKLIIHIKLIQEGETLSHFVAWDGKIITDKPKSSMVNSSSDRRNAKMSNLVFEKLFPKSEFSSWQITAVYQLILN